MSKSHKKNHDVLLRKFLDGELSPTEEKKALHTIAEDEELRSMLRFDRFLDTSFRSEPNLESFSVPEHFSDKVMDQIYQIESEKTVRQPRWEQIMLVLKSWFTPREFRIQPAVVYAVPIVLLIGFFTVLNISSGQSGQVPVSTSEVEFSSSEQSGKVWIRFVYIDEDAEQLAVAGNFSDWEPIEMDSQVLNGKKVWTSLIPVERGEHSYMFVRNGEEWVTDPLAEIQRDDGFGNKNAVIYL